MKFSAFVLAIVLRPNSTVFALQALQPSESVGRLKVAGRFAAGYGVLARRQQPISTATGKLDLAIADFRSGKISILLNSCW